MRLPSIAMPKLAASRAIPMPKPMKVPGPPKIAAIHVAKLNGGGFAVRRAMTHGPQPVPFVFSDPAKMLSHLRRIQKNAWLRPEKNPAPAIAHDLDLGPVS